MSNRTGNFQHMLHGCMCYRGLSKYVEELVYLKHFYFTMREFCWTVVEVQRMGKEKRKQMG